MCSGRWALALLAGSVGTLSAQDVPRLQARADSLLREWRRASAVADMVDSLNHTRAAGGTDTISVGALRIVTNPSPARLREAAARAWPVIDSLYGSEAQQLAQRPDPVQRGYASAGERRALVLRSFAAYFGYSDQGAGKPALQSCGAGSDAACTELLRSLPPGALPRPLT